jgi:putative membrane protein
MSFILHILVSALAIIITAVLVPGVEVTLVGSILVVIVLAILNMFLKPLIVLLTLPVNILTLGLFSIIINAFLVYLASGLTPGFMVAGFGSALVFAIVLALVNIVFNSFSDSR